MKLENAASDLLAASEVAQLITALQSTGLRVETPIGIGRSHSTRNQP